MKANWKWMFVAAAAFLLTSISFARGGTHQQATFTVADLQKMVDELSPYLPEDPRFAYPIKCIVEDKNEVNANARIIVDPKAPKDAKPQAKMTVYTGLLTFMKEMRLVRAVVAHEIAHLSKQHLGKGYKPKDLDLICEQKLHFLMTTGLVAPFVVNEYWEGFLKNKLPSINWARIWLLVSLANWIEKNSIQVE